MTTVIFRHLVQTNALPPAVKPVVIIGDTKLVAIMMLIHVWNGLVVVVVEQMAGIVIQEM